MATFPFIFDSLLYVPNKSLVDKVKLFFEKTWSSIHDDDDDDDDDDDISYFHIPVQIDDIIIKVRLSKFKERFWDNQKFIMCFYDYHNITETLILRICENLIQQFFEYKFDDILLLLVGIKDGDQNIAANSDTVPVKVDPNAKFDKLSVTDSKDNTGINSDIGPQLKKPNVRFAEWCVNSSDHDARKILQDFVRMVVIKGYFDTVRQLHEQSWFNQVEDRHMFSEDVPTQVTSWCLDSGSLFPVVTLRCLDLIRIAISHKTVDLFCIDTIEVGTSTLIWKNPFDWSHLQWNNTTDDKLFHFDLDNHTFQMPASSANQPISIFVNDIGSHSVILLLKSQEAETFGRSLVMVQNYSSVNLTELILQFKSLHHLVINDTIIDVTNLAFPSQLCETLKHLVMVDCNLTEVPQAVGSLTRLTLLNISDNYDIETLPVCLGNLRELRTFLYEDCPIEFPPSNVLRRSAREVVFYLRAFQDKMELITYNQSKLIVAGQEGVGKSTLIKAMDRKVWATDLKPPKKTDGVKIRTLDLEKTRFHVYDLAGDVEYLNTHPLFMSSKCLHLVVFDMSQILVGEGTRSDDQLCRLELWLQMIAAHHPTSYVIIVGTHADQERITKVILDSVRRQIVQLLLKYKNLHKEYFDQCILCNKMLLPEKLQEVKAGITLDDAAASESIIPHVLGYFEVSSIKKYPPAVGFANKNLESLKSAISSFNREITEAEFGIPKTWQSFYDKIFEKKMTPTVTFSDICSVAKQSEVPQDMVESMLRFFHSKGNFLWYEDIPEVRDVIFTEPQWFSDQLIKLISYEEKYGIRDGILYKPSLSVIWREMSEENRQRLLALFRSFNLCFSISDDEELFPCKLLIGWPDAHKWTPLPDPNEGGCQTSLLFSFNFLPPTFISKLILEVNKKRSWFPENTKPLYFRYSIMYVTKENKKCHICNHESKDANPRTIYHKVYYEVIPHRKAMKVAIRGPSPCCIVPDVCSTIKELQSSCYPGINFQTHLICPFCEMDRVDEPAIFSLKSPQKEEICSKYHHQVGSINVILRGEYKIRPIIDRRVPVVLEDYYCPKLFVVLPINTRCSSLRDRIVYSILNDGYAVHLLCECPNEWHFVDSPGFRIAKPKEFLEKYGKHLCTVLKFIGKLGTPLRAAAAADPLGNLVVAPVVKCAASVARELNEFLCNELHRYALHPVPYENLAGVRKSSYFRRSMLSKFLEIKEDVDLNGKFAHQLIPTEVDRFGEVMWLCERHRREVANVNTYM